MLVLTRKIDESIKIGEDIEIIILGRDGDQISIGIKAPKNVKIFRNEIYSQEKYKEKFNIFKILNK